MIVSPVQVTLMMTYYYCHHHHHHYHSVCISIDLKRIYVFLI